MDYLLICGLSLVIALISLFSGFGLGTVLMPFFAIFFPLPLAIIATAVVHLVNNLFKASLVGKFANWPVVVKFGIPAAFAALLGAYLMSAIAYWPIVATYELLHHEFNITALNLAVGGLLIISSMVELTPRFSSLSFPPKYIPLGGALSGLCGGISGQQGMLRAAFLIKSGISKEAFIGTSAVCSIIVDTVRLLIYGGAIYSEALAFPPGLKGMVIGASLSAFLGSYMGSRWIDKVAFKTVQILVGAMLLILGFAIALGII